jgi:hypothetical protein
VVLITRWFVVLLLSIFIIYTQNCNFFYDSVLCLKNPINLLSCGYLNNKLFYYYGDIKIKELSYRIQFLLDNFDKMDLKTVKYLRKNSIIFKQNPYSSFYHPHFLIELKNNIDNFNNFYINFQMSTNPNLGFEKLANTDLNMRDNKIQYISPYIRVYATNMVELVENEYIDASEFIERNKENIDNYVFKNLKEYVPNFEISKK